MAEFLHNGAAEGRPRRSWLRVLVALLVGLAGAVVIWVGSPFSDYVVGCLTWVGNSPVTDSYLPPVVLFLTLVLVLLANPILRLVKRSWALTKSQLAVVLGILLVACCLPGQGLLKSLPYAIAKVPLAVSEDKHLAEAYEEMKLPRSLFPGKLGYEAEASVSENFVQKLPEGEAVPWAAWIGPLLSWSPFLIACWFMMIGVALIVLPQWRNNERLPFPLLQLQESLIEEPEEGGLVAPLFKRRGFWVAMVVVFSLHLLAGLKLYNPGRVPAIPLKWDLGSLFREGVFQYTPWYIKQNQIYFMFVGLAFFMPSRIGFSIWFTQLGYAIYEIVGRAYVPPYHPTTAWDHRMGAMWAVAAAVLWFGRAHWARVFGCLFHRPRSEEDIRDRNAALLFLVGCAGMFAWLCWVGVHPLWAVFFVVFGFTVTLVVTRIVAETGMAFLRLHLGYYISLVHIAPLSWLSLPVLYFARFTAFLITVAGRVSVATMATHAIGLDREASPRRQWRTGVTLIWVLIIGLLICGVTHLWVNYHYDSSVDARLRPLNPWGLFLPDMVHDDVVKFREGRGTSVFGYSRLAHTGFGAGLAAALQWAYLRWTWWPLHPIGILMANVYYSYVTWISVFLGWLAKGLLVRYGGARVYRRSRAVFLGLIVGEVFAAVFWALEPGIRAAFGATYKLLQVSP